MRLRDLPSVDELARSSGDPLAVDAARAVLERAREQIRAGNDPGDLGESLRKELNQAREPNLRRVINATGVIAHTNLGRAPLAEPAIERVRDVARGYSNLEYDLAAGGRGSRQAHVAGILGRLTGAEAALVVNNNAAAVMLALAALAALEPSPSTLAGMTALLVAATFVEAFPVPIENVPVGGTSLATVFIVGTAVIYAIGVPWLKVVGGISWEAAVAGGMTKFLIWDAAKVAVAASLFPVAWWIIGRRPEDR